MVLAVAVTVAVPVGLIVWYYLSANNQAEPVLFFLMTYSLFGEL